MKKLTLLSFLLTISTCNLFSQVCGTDQLKLTLIAKDSNYLENEKKQNEWIHQSILSKKSKNTRVKAYECNADGVLVLPIVFHIIHNGEEIGLGTNLSDERIKYELLKLNERFRRKKGEDGDPIAVGADMEIEFAAIFREMNPKKNPSRLKQDGHVTKQQECMKINKLFFESWQICLPSTKNSNLAPLLPFCSIRLY